MTTTQQDLFNALTSSYSRVRLSSYRLQPGDPDMTVLSRYLWNMLLGEALFPTLQTLEVTLRNSMYDSIGVAYNQPDWYDIPGLLESFSQRDVAAAKQKLTDAAVKKRLPDNALQTPGRIVAELTFGFWTGLLSSNYETNPRFWPRLIVPMFPHAPKHLQTRRRIADTLHPLRYLRNRVFHHEPIWQHPQLKERHASILAVIRWINSDTYDTVMLFDRFPHVYQAGPNQCHTELQKIVV